MSSVSLYYQLRTRSEYGQVDRHHYSAQCDDLELGLCSYFLVSSIVSEIVELFYFVDP